MLLSNQSDETAGSIELPATFTNDLSMKFNLISAGEFDMGSPTTELNRQDDELLHKVVLNRYYAVTHQKNFDICSKRRYNGVKNAFQLWEKEKADR